MTKIRTTLLASFITVIVLMLFLTLFFNFMNLKVQEQYQEITNNMVLEYSIAETTTDLVAVYVSLIQDIENTGFHSQYNALYDDLHLIFETLDPQILFADSKPVYAKLKNTVESIKEDTDEGIAMTQKRDFSKSAVLYDQITRNEQYVKENTAALLMQELKYAKVLQQQIESMQKATWVIGTSLIVIITLGCLLLAFMFSNKISTPLANLSSLAEDISKGHLESKVSENLLDRKDEIGSLAGSFNIMLTKLNEKITEMSKIQDKMMAMTLQLDMDKERLEKAAGNKPEKAVKKVKGKKGKAKAAKVAKITKVPEAASAKLATASTPSAAPAISAEPSSSDAAAIANAPATVSSSAPKRKAAPKAKKTAVSVKAKGA
ncbi:HAMP domain-containing protein [Candidatus Woesearchaeota archaeon]|nr:HAMP domain-containing protein [Candidatus Woesearchaeota archaeon]